MSPAPAAPSPHTLPLHDALPISHCMRGTAGQKKIPETALRDPLVIEPARVDRPVLADRLRAHKGDILFHKHRFDVFTNEDRKSTRLNSSHITISYAVFCLKKKTS